MAGAASDPHQEAMAKEDANSERSRSYAATSPTPRPAQIYPGGWQRTDVLKVGESELSRRT